MEVSFHEEIKALRMGEGEVFRGEGILAITKGLLQSGVAYVGGYQGAPVSHLLDVMVQAKPLVMARMPSPRNTSPSPMRRALISS